MKAEVCSRRGGFNKQARSQTDNLNKPARSRSCEYLILPCPLALVVPFTLYPLISAVFKIQEINGKFRPLPIYFLPWYEFYPVFAQTPS